jgi:ankyrin repeat protein
MCRGLRWLGRAQSEREGGSSSRINIDDAPPKYSLFINRQSQNRNMTKTQIPARFPAVLSWRSAGSASPGGVAELAQLWDAWVNQLSTMESVAKDRGWNVKPLSMAAPVSESVLRALDARLMQRMGRVLPAPLRWLLSRASNCTFGWRAPAEDLPSGDFDACYDGGGELWDLEQIDHTGVMLSSWVENWVAHHQAEEEDSEAQALQTFWDGHLSFLRLRNGDMLTLDLRSDDPTDRPVRYFSHERDGHLHGEVIAPDLFEFLSTWIALGCVGSTWHAWSMFTAEEGAQSARLDAAGLAAQRWRMWLAEDPALAPAGNNARPKPVRAVSAADFALLKAAAVGGIKSVEAAVAAGAQIDCTDLDDYCKDDHTAVVLAAKRDDLSMLQCLVRNGASLATHKLPLLAVTTTAHASTLLWLIQAGARIDPWPDDRFSALHRLLDADQLSRDEYLTVLDAMLAAGANPDVGWDTASSGATTTLLMRAGPKTQARLLAAGANPQARDQQGCTAMHYAQSAEQIAVLTSHGLDVNSLSTPPLGDTATTPLQGLLRAWSQTAPTEAVEAFLSAGADPAITDSMGNNAWAYCRHLACAKLLAKRLPFDRSWRNARGQTCLHFTLQQVHRLEDHCATLWPQMVCWGLEVNAQDADGNTALHIMAGYVDSMHDVPSIQLLLDLGASWDVRNQVGKTPMDLIKKKYRTSVGALVARPVVVKP